MYWYDYCRPVKEVYSYLAKQYPSEIFSKDQYGRCGDNCMEDMKENFFKTKATFKVIIKSQSDQEFNFKVVYKVNNKNDGTGICKLVSFEEIF